jgi:hypothetical protein
VRFCFCKKDETLAEAGQARSASRRAGTCAAHAGAAARRTELADERRRSP